LLTSPPEAVAVRSRRGGLRTLRGAAQRCGCGGAVGGL